MICFYEHPDTVEHTVLGCWICYFPNLPVSIDDASEDCDKTIPLKQ